MNKRLMVIIVSASLVCLGACGKSNEELAQEKAEMRILEERAYNELKKEENKDSTNAAFLAANLNNIKQIYRMMIHHRKDTGQFWPNPWEAVGLEVPKPKNADDAQLMTAVIFEYMASKWELSPYLFIPPNEDYSEELALSMRTAAEIVEAPKRLWAAGYGFDWATPKESVKNRPILAMRSPFAGKIAVVYYDQEYTSNNTETYSINEIKTDSEKLDQISAAKFTIIRNHNKDNMFTNTEDQSKNDVYAMGSIDKAWLK